MPRIRTARLLLISATAADLEAELVSRDALAASLGAVVPGSWPPELYDEAAVRWTLAALEADPRFAEWGFYYVTIAPADTGVRPLLIGAGGFKGPPDSSGAVEVGYAIVPEQRRRGYAREAVDGWLSFAFAEPRVVRVMANTLAELEPSIGVLRSAGFRFVGAGTDPHEPEAIRFEITRAEYEGTRAGRSVARLVDR